MEQGEGIKATDKRKTIRGYMQNRGKQRRERQKEGE